MGPQKLLEAGQSLRHQGCLRWFLLFFVWEQVNNWTGQWVAKSFSPLGSPTFRTFFSVAATTLATHVFASPSIVRGQRVSKLVYAYLALFKSMCLERKSSCHLEGAKKKLRKLACTNDSWHCQIIWVSESWRHQAFMPAASSHSVEIFTSSHLALQKRKIQVLAVTK